MDFRWQNITRLLALIGFTLLGAHLAQACSVCVVGKDEARAAYYATTAVMSLLPLCMIGGVVYFINKKSR